MNIKEKKLKIKNLKAFYMDDWELTEEQKDQLDALATDILNAGIEQGRLESSVNREGYKLVPVDSLNKILAISDTIDNVLCGINEDDNIQSLLISIDDEVNAMIGAVE